MSNQSQVVHPPTLSPLLRVQYVHGKIEKVSHLPHETDFLLELERRKPRKRRRGRRKPQRGREQDQSDSSLIIYILLFSQSSMQAHHLLVPTKPLLHLLQTFTILISPNQNNRIYKSPTLHPPRHIHGSIFRAFPVSH